MTFVLSRRSGERNAGAACVLLSSGASHISPSTGSWPDERVGEGLGLCSTVVGRLARMHMSSNKQGLSAGKAPKQSRSAPAATGLGDRRLHSREGSS